MFFVDLFAINKRSVLASIVKFIPGNLRDLANSVAIGWTVTDITAI